MGAWKRALVLLSVLQAFLVSAIKPQRFNVGLAGHSVHVHGRHL
jgi:hypothetical protein